MLYRHLQFKFLASDLELSNQALSALLKFSSPQLWEETELAPQDVHSIIPYLELLTTKAKKKLVMSLMSNHKLINKII